MAAMVLLDATQEEQYLLPPAWKALGGAMLERYRRQARWAPLDVELGIKRLQLWIQGVQAPYLLPQSKYFAARASELETIQVSAEQARDAGSLGAKPLIVLTGGRNRDGMLSAGLSQRDLEEYQRIWVEDLQPRLAALSTRSKWVVLPTAVTTFPRTVPTRS